MGVVKGSVPAACKRLMAAMSFSVVALLLAAGTAAAKKEVNIVSHTIAPKEVVTKTTRTRYFDTIQGAVEASKKKAFILIEPGKYNEEVKVTKQHSGIYIRGMDRNKVIVDGMEEKWAGGRNGIEIYKADDVWVENLTVRNFERDELNGSGGNEIWWNGGAESEKIGAHGWFGKYLTAYDTGLDGGYGIFTSNETKGEWDKIYASGFNDSGIYIGACPECEAVVNEADMEYNALGYSGSNSGGNLVIENSIFAHNTTGIAPNSENPGDGPPPQNGACEHSKPLKKVKGEIKRKGELPKFTSTNFARCTIIKDNLITENSDLTAPANTSAAAAPWGAGVELPGDYGDMVENNTITRNPSDGVLAFEYPNPFPPLTEEEAQEQGYETIFFQNSGNEIKHNKFAENGTLGKYAPYEGDVAFEGGGFGSHESIDNCLTENEFTDSVYPVHIEGTWGCQNTTTPNPTPEGDEWLPFVKYLLALQEESENRPEIKAVGPPPEQPTMPDPCEGVPNNPLCEEGKVKA